MANWYALANRVMCALVLSAGAAFAGESTTQPTREAGTDNIVSLLLDRSRLLNDVQFQVPIAVYQQYLRELSTGATSQPAPVAYIAESGNYTLNVDKDRNVTLKAEIRFRVFDPAAVRNIPLLSDKLTWQEITVNGKPASLAATDGFFRWSADTAGVFTIAASAPMPKAAVLGGELQMAVFQTVATAAIFESPGMWEVKPDASKVWKSLQESPPSETELGQVSLVGTADRGTHGRLALPPTNNIIIRYSPPTVQAARASRYELSGDIAWNIDTAAQQISADLKVAIGGGASDKFEIILPAGADRIAVTGPEVQQFQADGGKVAIFLRSKVLGTTPIKVSYELPLGGNSQRAIGRFDVKDGHWSGGMLVVTNTAGASELLPATVTGLTEASPFELPNSAKALLAGPAVLAYRITSRQFDASVEVLQLGQFALRQSVADLAHYETFLDTDGSTIGRARYEIRNRNKQFLRVSLPAGAVILLARVNEKSVPVTPVEGKEGQYLLRLERSLPSVKGLVSFPVEIVYTARAKPLCQAGKAEIALPTIDLPVAYAWCQSYLPDGMDVRSVGGPMKRVEQFSSQTAKASLDYGYGTMAEGYAEIARPTAASAPPAKLAKTPNKAAGSWFGGDAESFTPPHSGKMSDGGLDTKRKDAPPMGVIINGGNAPTPGFGTMLGVNGPPASSGNEALALGGGQVQTRIQSKPTTRPATQPMPADMVVMTDRNVGGKVDAPQQPANRAADGESTLRRDGNVRFQDSVNNAAKPTSDISNYSLKAEDNSGWISTVELNAGLARNYYRAGKEFYDKGDNPNAAASLEKVKQLAPGSIEAENADRLLANVFVLVKGNYDTSGKTGTAQKAAAMEVQQQATEKTRRLEWQQTALVEQAMGEARAGKTSAAKNTLQAAQGINAKINWSNAGNAEAQAQGKEIAQQLAEVSKSDQAEMAKLNAQMDQYAAAGQYDKAIDVANTIRLQGGNTQELAKKIESIVVAQTRDSMQRSKGKSSPKTTVDPFTGGIVPEKGTSAWGEGKDNEIQTKAGLGFLTKKPSNVEKITTASSPSRYSSLPDGGGRTMVNGVFLDDINVDFLNLSPREKEKIMADARENQRKAADADNPITEHISNRKILRDIALMEFDKQLQLSREALTGADKPSSFDGATQAADAARDQIASNKTVFDSPQEYQDKLNQAEEQIKYVALQRETYQKRQSTVAATKAESANQERVEKQVAAKRAALAALKVKAKDLTKDQKYAEAAAVLDQILQLDPNDDYANNAKDITIQLRDLHREKVAYDEMRREFQASKVSIRESEIPFEKELEYPRNWIDHTAKREGYNSSAADTVEADSLIKQKLKTRIPKLDLNNEEFANVIDFFRTGSNVNFHPDWQALAAAGVDRKTPVNLNLVDVTIEKAFQLVLQDLSTTKKLSYAIGGGVVTISTSEELAKIPVYKTYDVQDLLFVVPDFTGPTVSLGGNNNSSGGNNNSASQDTDARSQEVQRIIDTIRQTIGEDSWNDFGVGSIKEFNGQLIVSQTAENQEMIADVLSRLRQARGPQVQIDNNIAQQRASGTLNLNGTNTYTGGNNISSGHIEREGGVPILTNVPIAGRLFTNRGKVRDEETLPANQLIKPKIIMQRESEADAFPPMRVSSDSSDERNEATLRANQMTMSLSEDKNDLLDALSRRRNQNEWGVSNEQQKVLADNPQLSTFIAKNYGWTNEFSYGMRWLYDTNNSNNVAQLVNKLGSNLGQKVAVNSTNINVSPSVAARAGVQFKSGNNLQWATIDEAQFRTLMELDAQIAAGRTVPSNGRLQETIVGTDALLANGMISNIVFAGEIGNSLAVNGNSVALPHESYLLISNGQYLTAVKAGAMQHWTTPVTSAMFAPVPQTIEVPRVGQLVNLEKTLLESNDRLVISAEYTWKGVSK